MVSGEYPLRPEIIESAYDLHRKTGDPRYLEMGRVFLEALVEHCRTEVGFAAIKDVRTMEKMDAMESFLFAETLKYLYLLFAPDSAFDLDAYVLTTEAHPLKAVGATSRDHAREGKVDRGTNRLPAGRLRSAVRGDPRPGVRRRWRADAAHAFAHAATGQPDSRPDPHSRQRRERDRLLPGRTGARLGRG